jgi:predicted  nucleic acid-binding Zn-ribbon protein
MNTPEPGLTGLTIRNLVFTGSAEGRAELALQPGLNVLYGASNTGKSFAVKTIDFMLGSTRALPDIDERKAFERAWMALTLPAAGDITLMRALAGGSLELYPGHVSAPGPADQNIRQLSAKHNHTNRDNISQFLLDELGFAGKQVATDLYGKKRSLSFRDLARFCIVDETAIQSEASPAESGQYVSPTVERSVFKLLITGQDDSAIVPVVDRKTFKTSTAAKLEMIDEMIASINDELAADFPNAAHLADQNRLLEESWTRAQRDVQMAQESIRARLAAKRQLGLEISSHEQRRAEIEINFGRFEQLEEVYRSDIERLEAIEEAGFLLALGGDKACPLCGAPPEAQRQAHGLADIERARDAAGAEIDKIGRQRTELRATIEQLGIEGEEIERKLERFDDQLTKLESDLAQLAPVADVAKKRVPDEGDRPSPTSGCIKS